MFEVPKMKFFAFPFLLGLCALLGEAADIGEFTQFPIYVVRKSSSQKAESPRQTSNRSPRQSRRKSSGQGSFGGGFYKTQWNIYLISEGEFSTTGTFVESSTRKFVVPGRAACEVKYENEVWSCVGYQPIRIYDELHPYDELQKSRSDGKEGVLLFREDSRIRSRSSRRRSRSRSHAPKKTVDPGVRPDRLGSKKTRLKSSGKRDLKTGRKGLSGGRTDTSILHFDDSVDLKKFKKQNRDNILLGGGDIEVRHAGSSVVYFVKNGRAMKLVVHENKEGKLRAKTVAFPSSAVGLILRNVGADLSPFVEKLYVPPEDSLFLVEPYNFNQFASEYFKAADVTLQAHNSVKWKYSYHGKLEADQLVKTLKGIRRSEKAHSDFLEDDALGAIDVIALLFDGQWSVKYIKVSEVEAYQASDEYFVVVVLAPGYGGTSSLLIKENGERTGEGGMRFMTCPYKEVIRTNKGGVIGEFYGGRRCSYDTDGCGEGVLPKFIHFGDFRSTEYGLIEDGAAYLPSKLQFLEAQPDPYADPSLEVAVPDDPFVVCAKEFLSRKVDADSAAGLTSDLAGCLNNEFGEKIRREDKALFNFLRRVTYVLQGQFLYHTVKKDQKNEDVAYSLYRELDRLDEYYRFFLVDMKMWLGPEASYHILSMMSGPSYKDVMVVTDARQAEGLRMSIDYNHPLTTISRLRETYMTELKEHFRQMLTLVDPRNTNHVDDTLHDTFFEPRKTSGEEKPRPKTVTRSIFNDEIIRSVFNTKAVDLATVVRKGKPARFCPALLTDIPMMNKLFFIMISTSRGIPINYEQVIEIQKKILKTKKLRFVFTFDKLVRQECDAIQCSMKGNKVVQVVQVLESIIEKINETKRAPPLPTPMTAEQIAEDKKREPYLIKDAEQYDYKLARELREQMLEHENAQNSKVVA